MGDLLGRVDRRGFLKGAGAAAVVVSLGSAGALWPGRAAASGGAAATARRRTYAALVEAVGAAPGNQVRAEDSAAATRSFAADYARFSRTQRQAADDALDAIAPAGRPFHALDVPGRLDLLRARLRDGTPAERDATLRAVALAAAPFQPDPDEFGRVPVTLA